MLFQKVHEISPPFPVIPRVSRGIQYKPGLSGCCDSTQHDNSVVKIGQRHFSNFSQEASPTGIPPKRNIGQAPRMVESILIEIPQVWRINTQK